MKKAKGRNILINTETEIVERKGIGHPDSVCDIIAESFSNSYSKYCEENFGEVLNHWFDKVLISGGEAKIKPGYSKIVKKPRVYLFGKITKTEKDDFVEKLFRETVNSVFCNIFKIKAEMLPDIFVDVNSGIGTDHNLDFYKYNLKSKTDKELESNDTVFCNGYYPYSKLENYVISIENYINSEDFKSTYPETGWDVKVLAKRIDDNVEITICVPFIAEKILDWKFYEKLKIEIKNDLTKFSKIFGWNECNIHLNTKDFKNHGYLTVYGSALDKGDFGVVGRGNRYSGFISLNRGETQEAYHGKNPIIHSGKLFTVVSHRISRKIYDLTGVGNKSCISIDNGSALLDPETVGIVFNNNYIPEESIKNSIESIIDTELKNIKLISQEIIKSDPVSDFKERNILTKNI